MITILMKQFIFDLQFSFSIVYNDGDVVFRQICQVSSFLKLSQAFPSGLQPVLL